MNILLIEDEPNAAIELRALIRSCRPAARFETDIDTVEDAISFFRSGKVIDLVFMDIHLSDGTAFAAFEFMDPAVPVIFTTAYDQYALRAFEVNSVDYLLKPIDPAKLERALVKVEQQSRLRQPTSDPHYLDTLREFFAERRIYKQNFLVPFKGKLLPVPANEFAWFEAKNGVVIGTRTDKNHFVLEERSLDELAAQLCPEQFFRVNRQFLVNRMSIKEAAQYFNGKLYLTVFPTPSSPVLVSRGKATAFKEWMGH